MSSKRTLPNLLLIVVLSLLTSHSFAKLTKEEKQQKKIAELEEQNKKKAEKKQKKEEAENKRKENREKRLAEEKAKEDALKQKRDEKRQAKKEQKEVKQALDSIKKNDKIEELLDEKIAKEEKQLAELQAMRGQYCQDATQPCSFDEVLKAAGDHIESLKKRKSDLNAQDLANASACHTAQDNLNQKDQHWTGIINQVQPIRDRIKKRIKVIKDLEKTQAKTDPVYRASFAQALKSERKALAKDQHELDKLYKSLTSKMDRSVAGSFGEAKLHKARLEKKKGRINQLCEPVLQAEASVNAGSEGDASADADGSEDGSIVGLR